MKDNRDGSELIRAWEKQNNIHRYEGESGVQDLEALVQALDPNYQDLQSFLADNPDCCSAMVEWITEWVDWSREWKERLVKAVGPEASDEARNRIRQDARTMLINIQGATGEHGELLVWVIEELETAEDIANRLCEADETLKNSDGKLLVWVIEECQRAIDQLFAFNIFVSYTTIFSQLKKDNEEPAPIAPECKCHDHN